MYARSDGSRLITDHPRVEPGYKLVKVYASEVDDDASYISSPKKRPSANSSKYDGLIQRVSDTVILDPALIKSVMHAESAFDAQAVSRKGASGLMQLMPGTAYRYGVTRIFNPQQNVMAGSRYLRDLLQLFDGDMRLALAGYNAGENAVLKYGDVPPYAETQQYVHKVMNLYRQYRNGASTERGNLECDNAPSGVKLISCTPSKKTTNWVTNVQ